MGKFFHRILYRLLSLENYLRVVSRMFFVYRALGLGRKGRALEYVYHLPQLVAKGDTAIDIGANLGYYAKLVKKLLHIRITCKRNQIYFICVERWKI